MRIYHDPIRYRDGYRVTRKGKNVYIRWVADGNTTFPWPSPEEDGFIVSGPAHYDGDRQGTWDIKILDMVINAIQQAQGMEYDPGPQRDTLEEERSEKRAFIQENLRWIPELDN